MNIPHQEPIKFAQELLELDGNIVKVKCRFQSIPTLPMLFEAAAQSSAGFSQEEKIGFLVSVKNVKLLIEPKEFEYIIQVEKKVEFGAICEFYFDVLTKENSKIANGILTIMIQE